MNRQQRMKNRATARALTDEVFEAGLPEGLTYRNGDLFYDCEGCERECEWYGTPEEFAEPDAIRLGGCSPRCCP